MSTDRPREQLTEPPRCCGSPPPVPSTTASPPSSAGCCTTPSRSSPTSWRPSSAPRASRGQDAPDLALLTDGLRAEREQGITIDVAYRYFATPRRRFILADTPGHVQYTRNMVTGASTAELAVVLVDARNGVVEQTRRHAAVAALLRVPHVVLAVNKMDLVDYAGARVRRDRRGVHARTPPSLGVPEITAIPISALAGDNVVDAVREHGLVRRPDRPGAPGDGPGQPTT